MPPSLHTACLLGIIRWIDFLFHGTSKQANASCTHFLEVVEIFDFTLITWGKNGPKMNENPLQAVSQIEILGIFQVSENKVQNYVGLINSSGAPCDFECDTHSGHCYTPSKHGYTRSEHSVIIRGFHVSDSRCLFVWHLICCRTIHGGKKFTCIWWFY